jgi:hypothetical protein
VPALSFRTIEQSEYLKYDSNQYIEKWCEMENMKFMETDEDNGSKIFCLINQNFKADFLCAFSLIYWMILKGSCGKSYIKKGFLLRKCLAMGIELTSARSLATTSDSDSSCAGISAGKPEKIQKNY